MEHGNMLAIVGSPGSGKTTLAVKLAAEIAKKKKNVIVVCSDQNIRYRINWFLLGRYQGVTTYF